MIANRLSYRSSLGDQQVQRHHHRLRRDRHARAGTAGRPRTTSGCGCARPRTPAGRTARGRWPRPCQRDDHRVAQQSGRSRCAARCCSCRSVGCGRAARGLPVERLVLAGERGREHRVDAGRGRRPARRASPGRPAGWRACPVPRRRRGGRPRPSGRRGRRADGAACRVTCRHIPSRVLRIAPKPVSRTRISDRPVATIDQDGGDGARVAEVVALEACFVHQVRQDRRVGARTALGQDQHRLEVRQRADDHQHRSRWSWCVRSCGSVMEKNCR